MPSDNYQYYPPQNNADQAWLSALRYLLDPTTEGGGQLVGPRGMGTIERQAVMTTVDMSRPIVTAPSRKLNYRFMAAEAYWILTGDNRVETIEPYCKEIAKFSDDGEVFAGAYGPRIIEQLPFVLRKLAEDTDTRQAVLTIWKESPPNSADIPCTVAMVFQLRRNELDLHVFMRSSDAWLGCPYDIFSFSMVAFFVCGLYNNAIVDPWQVINMLEVEKAALVARYPEPDEIKPGTLYLQAASLHLYERDIAKAMEVLIKERNAPPTFSNESAVPRIYAVSPRALLEKLDRLRYTTDEWWFKDFQKIRMTSDKA
jgi:thymidylate synthase